MNGNGNGILPLNGGRPKPKVYLESSVFSALWGREEGKWKVGREILNDGRAGRIEIVVSALVMVECEAFVGENGVDLLAEFFESEWIVRCNVDPFVAQTARQWRGQSQVALTPNLWLHAATAWWEECDFLFSYDKRLLRLNGHPSLEKVQIATPMRPWDAGQMSLEDIAGVMPADEDGWTRRSLVI